MGADRNGTRFAFLQSVGVWFDEAWMASGPDIRRLWELAERQGGYFTAAEARGCGYRRALLSYHARRDWIVRVRRGIYRLHDHPASPFDDLRVEWMAAGRESAVICGETALYLHRLLPEDPWIIHLMLERSRRWYAGPGPRVRLHTPLKPLPASEIVEREGVRVTVAERSIVDAVGVGIVTADLSSAVAAALFRGEASIGGLMRRAGERGRRIEWLVAQAIRKQAIRASP